MYCAKGKTTTTIKYKISLTQSFVETNKPPIFHFFLNRMKYEKAKVYEDDKIKNSFSNEKHYVNSLARFREPKKMCKKYSLKKSVL